MTDSEQNHIQPSAKQLRYLRDLAASRGESFAYPQTKAEASEQIERLRARPRTSTAEHRREDRQTRRELSEGTRGDSASIRPEEIEGYGSSARWLGRPGP